MRIYCEAKCETCVHALGRVRNVFDHEQETYMCDRCRKVYFCEAGIGKRYDEQTGKLVMLYCLDCDYPLVKRRLDKALMEKIKFIRFIAGEVPPINYLTNIVIGDLRYTEVSEEDSRLKAMLTEGQEYYIKSKIEALEKSQAIDVDLIITYARFIGFSNDFLESIKNFSLLELLEKFSELYPSFIETLYRILIERNYTTDLDFQLAFLANFKKEHPNTKIHFPTEEEREIAPVDIWLQEEGKEDRWAIVRNLNVDLKEYQDLITPVLSLPPTVFANVREIYVVSRSFSWNAILFHQKYSKILPTIYEEGTAGEKKRKEIPIFLYIDTKDGFEKVS